MKRYAAALVVGATIVFSALLFRARELPPNDPPFAVDELLHSEPRPSKSSPKDATTDICFRDVTPDSGVDFTFCGNPTSNAYMTEQNGGGVALMDFDRDGEMDILLVNSTGFSDAPRTFRDSNQIYRNIGRFKYQNVTDPSGLVAFGVGMGCATGDFDNDGFQDVVVTYYGRDRMWKNQGDGTFIELTQESGVAGSLWGTSAAFADMNEDGLSDLYVVNYVDWTKSVLPCHPPGHPEINSICSPVEQAGQEDFLYQNLGDGRFREVLQQSGTDIAASAKGLAISVVDFDRDGLPDVYVANDTSRNFLYHNQGALKFQEVAVSSGVAISGDGRVGSGMGVAIADFDANGFPDIVVTNFRNQNNDLFANFGGLNFAARNAQTGLDAVSRLPLGFGVAATDFNLDGFPDLFVANGHIWDWEILGDEFEYHMRPQLLLGGSDRRFQDISETAGDYFQKRWLGRAVAMADLDGDGDCDVVVTHADSSPAILENQSERSGRTIELAGRRGARDGRALSLTVNGDSQTYSFSIPSGGSFQSSHAPQIVIPSTMGKVSVRWSRNESQDFTLNLTLSHHLLIESR